MGSPEAGHDFLEKRWPEARAVSDDDESLYDAFGLTNASMGQLFGPSVFKSGLQAMLRGNGIGLPVGNPLRMSGWFLVHENEIVWSHVHEHAGSERDYEGLERAIADLREEAR